MDFHRKRLQDRLVKSSSRRPVRESYRHGNLRAALVDEAVKLMEQRPDAAFTLREVAQLIGVSHSAAYRHFPNKGGLLAEIACQGFDALAQTLRETTAKAGSPEAAIRQQGRAYVRMALTRPAHFRCMFGPKSLTGEDAKRVEVSAESAYAALNDVTARLLKTAPDAKETERASLSLWSLVHGLASLALDGNLKEFVSEESAAHYERLADVAVASLLEGLAPEETR